MKKRFMLLFVCAIVSTCTLSASISFKRKRHHQFNGWYTSYGGSVGQESLLGIKLSAYKDFPFGQSRAMIRKETGFRNRIFYVGGEWSFLVLFGGVFRWGINPGVKLGPVTIGNSFARTSLISPEGEVEARYYTSNPKVGLSFGEFWIKAGPSFLLQGNLAFPLWMRTGNVGWNIEIARVMRS